MSLPVKHDDKLDALAMAVRYWVESMSRDENLAKEDHNKRLLDQELKKFVEQCKKSPIPWRNTKASHRSFISRNKW